MRRATEGGQEGTSARAAGLSVRFTFASERDSPRLIHRARTVQNTVKIAHFTVKTPQNLQNVFHGGSAAIKGVIENFTVIRRTVILR